MVAPRVAPVPAQRRPQSVAWRERPPEDTPSATVADGAVEPAVLIQCLITAVD